MLLSECIFYDFSSFTLLVLRSEAPDAKQYFLFIWFSISKTLNIYHCINVLILIKAEKPVGAEVSNALRRPLHLPSSGVSQRFEIFSRKLFEDENDFSISSSLEFLQKCQQDLTSAQTLLKPWQPDPEQIGFCHNSYMYYCFQRAMKWNLHLMVKMTLAMLATKEEI